MEEKYINRFLSFEKSLGALLEARNRDIEDDFVLSGTIHKFSITFDIAWKVMKDALTGYYGVTDFATGSPRDVLRKAMSCSIISEDTWIDMMLDRNALAHDYDGAMAKEKIRTIIDIYIPIMEKFADKARDIYDIET